MSNPKKISLEEIQKLLEQKIFLSPFVGKFALLPEELLTWADNSGLATKLKKIDSWDAFEKGDIYFDENDFLSLLNNDKKYFNSEVIFVSDETIKRNSGYNFNMENFMSFVEFYEDIFNESFFQPHDYILIFVYKREIEIIHHEGYLINITLADECLQVV